MLSTIRATAARPCGWTSSGIGLDDVHLGLEQGRADFHEALGTAGQFDADQIALDDRQPGPLQNLAPLFGVAQQEADEGALGGIGDRKGDDADLAPLETADHFEQLPYPIFEKDRKLADGGIIPPAHCGITRIGRGSIAHAVNYRKIGKYRQPR